MQMEAADGPFLDPMSDAYAWIQAASDASEASLQHSLEWGS